MLLLPSVWTSSSPLKLNLLWTVLGWGVDLDVSSTLKCTDRELGNSRVLNDPSNCLWGMGVRFAGYDWCLDRLGVSYRCTMSSLLSCYIFLNIVWCVITWLWDLSMRVESTLRSSVTSSRVCACWRGDIVCGACVWLSGSSMAVISFGRLQTREADFCGILNPWALAGANAHNSWLPLVVVAWFVSLVPVGIV